MIFPFPRSQETIWCSLIQKLENGLPWGRSIIYAPKWSIAVVSPNNDASIHLSHNLNWALKKLLVFSIVLYCNSPRILLAHNNQISSSNLRLVINVILQHLTTSILWFMFCYRKLYDQCTLKDRHQNHHFVVVVVHRFPFQKIVVYEMNWE